VPGLVWLLLQVVLLQGLLLVLAEYSLQVLRAKELEARQLLSPAWQVQAWLLPAQEEVLALS